jgi:hypothetical protein
MAEYRQSAHAVYDLKYHMIWCTKYRKKILRGRIAERVRDLIRQTCAARARRWARWMRQRSRRISRISGGTKTMSHSKSQRPPSLKPAVSREAFRRLQTQRDFQSPKDSTGFKPVVINHCGQSLSYAALRRIPQSRRNPRATATQVVGRSILTDANRLDYF